ncbi:Para-nitrophenol 4-monooxygenase [Pigmentiphaga humi]|uniref:Para-nitrophenol 4-monooxygenase n=1 Tax=Pigmentiphaga humi TaxID=2478468 RepID=A0A3P4B6C9_9BURK|nr:NAD(P)/FAD-dependent oxidoreductase [Pigmentiphaga humi]VCU71086.1 Para-nitrophenol 4-monooxygenase [Pigmentiphaga humi]
MAIKQVIVAGAGPVGMLCAFRLARAGIPVTVLERGTDLAEDLRASTWHPPTLDMMEELGLADDIIRMGLIARYVQYRDRRSGTVAEFDMDLLRGETGHPYRVQCEQFKFTRLVYERLSAFPHCRVLFGARLTGFEQDADKVTVIMDRGNGSERLEADYLIGADGAWSTVRRVADIEFEGMTYPERFYVATTAFEFADVLPRLSYVNYVADTEEWFLLLKVPGSWRCLFPTRVDETDEEVVSDARTQARLQGVHPRNEPYRTLHRTIYAVHQRVARKYRQGRVVLAGDAAHINNPLGGMGMNGGLHDAMSLCTALERIDRAEADESALDGYERQRRPIAIEYINASTQRNKKVMEERDPEARRRSQEEMCRQAEDSVRAKEFLKKSSMIDALRAAGQLR